MLKECLFDLISSKIDIGDNRKKMISKYINMIDEGQLYHIMQSNIGLIADDINIHFYNGIGFRCSNNPIYGRMPICNLIQRILNEKYDIIIKETIFV
jgi:hypothetical protein